MARKRNVGLGMLAAAAACGTAGAIAVTRPSTAGGAGIVSVQQARALFDAQEEGLRMRLVVAATTKPLLDALANHVDGRTLSDLFRSQDWWRDVRSDFQLARVIVGGQVLASEGPADPGARDRDVVVQARKQGVASALVAVGDHAYAFVAGRLPVLPDKVPVLVLAKVLDDGSGARGFGGLWLFVLAAGNALGGAGLLVASRRSRAGERVPRIRDATLESTLPLGSTAPHKAASRSGPAPAAATGAGPSAGAKVAPAGSVTIRGKATPPPPDLSGSQTPQAGYVRHPTSPDGTPVAADGTPGQPFGRYQLLNRLGEGGMSEVFTAIAHGAAGFSRVFVLKRLRQELSHDKEAVSQFIDEARLQASLVHSNIVPVFDFGRVGDEYFMTQEYIVGRDVTRVMASFYEAKQQTLNPRLAYYLAHETLRALHYAHTRRDKDGQPLDIVHRDVSAGNIILSAEGEVKLADFGIVKSNKRTTKTQVGMVKGNANFMSPEQARGQEVDARSDLFSVGLVLFYMLTNRLIYDGDNDLDVLFKAASGPPASLAEEIEHLPLAIRAVTARALAFAPADRFQTAAEFADALAPHIAGAKNDAAELMDLLFGRELAIEAA